MINLLVKTIRYFLKKKFFPVFIENNRNIFSFENNVLHS